MHDLNCFFDFKTESQRGTFSSCTFCCTIKVKDAVQASWKRNYLTCTAKSSVRIDSLNFELMRGYRILGTRFSSRNKRMFFEREVTEIGKSNREKMCISMLIKFSFLTGKIYSQRREKKERILTKLILLIVVEFTIYQFPRCNSIPVKFNLI